MSHALFLPDFDAGNLEPLSSAVAVACDILPTDARLRLRQGWGFLEWNTSQEEVSELAARLRLSGAASEIVKVDELRGTGEPEVMCGITLSAEGLVPEARLPGAKAHLVPWDEIAIVAAAGFPEDAMHREAINLQSKARRMISLGLLLASGVPNDRPKNGKARFRDKSARTTQFVSFGQIVTTRNESWFFNADSFNFGGLQEAKQMSSSQNFRALIVLLTERSRARLNRGARCIVEKRGMSAANYESVGDFERELLWMLNSDQSSNPGPILRARLA